MWSRFGKGCFPRCSSDRSLSVDSTRVPEGDRQLFDRESVLRHGVCLRSSESISYEAECLPRRWLRYPIDRMNEYIRTENAKATSRYLEDGSNLVSTYDKLLTAYRREGLYGNRSALVSVVAPDHTLV